MKKLSKLFLVLSMLVFAITLVIPFNASNAKASDKFMEKYFPNGIEKIKPYKPLIDIDENDTYNIGAIIKQNDDILKLVRDYEACEEYVDFSDDFYCEDSLLKFYVDNGIDALETTVQFDISVDGGDWQYKKSWDKKEQDNYADGFCFYESFGGADDDNSVYFSIMDAGVAAGGKLLKKTVKNDQFDLKNHTFKVRYRYCVQYGLLNNHEAGIQYNFTDWSDTTTFGKTTDQNLEIPDEMPAPDISNPKRELDNKGKWGGYVSVMTHFSQEVTDASNAIYINTGEREPFVVIVEAAVDDLSEKKFEEGSMANAVWLSDGQRGLSFDNENSFTEKSRILIRSKVRCETLDKDSKYDYAVDKVKGLKVKKAKTTSLTLTWNKVAEAEFYEIYDKDNKLVATSKTNSVTIKKIKAATGYDYKVRAVVDKVFVGLFSDTLQCGTQPKKTKISKAALSGESFSATYKKVAGTGYQIQVSTDKKFKKSAVDATIPDIKTIKVVTDVPGAEALKGSTIHVRVRAYFTYGDVTTYGSWSKVKSIKVK